MKEENQYNWFLIMCSWDWNADKDALRKFEEVYNYINTINTENWDKVPDSELLKAIDKQSLKALNLIGQRKFVIIGRTTSNRVLQKISSIITLGTAIRVEVFPATYVHDFKEKIADRFKGKKYKI